MAQEDRRSEAAEQTDEATAIKKRARRRLIGAIALALLAAIVLPMVMDHEPAPTLKDIQVRIPSPDEGITQRLAVRPAEPLAAVKEPAAAPVAEPVKPIAKAPEPAPKTEPTKGPPAEAPKAGTQASADDIRRGEEALAGRPPTEQWEVQLGAYQNPASVANLVKKLKELGIPTYTEKVDTPNGPRTRVRAGPFPTEEAAERARARVKIVGVDGPVARKP